MKFKKQFAELAEKYNLSYQYQKFTNCFGNYDLYKALARITSATLRAA